MGSLSAGMGSLSLSASPPDPARVQENGQRERALRCFPCRAKPRDARSSAAECRRPENNVGRAVGSPTSPGAGRSVQVRAFPSREYRFSYSPKVYGLPGKKHLSSLQHPSRSPLLPRLIRLRTAETGTAAKKSRESRVLAEGIALRSHQNQTKVLTGDGNTRYRV
ncbi:unnamed protein product [Coccothraustes coccothraustes]